MSSTGTFSDREGMVKKYSGSSALTGILEKTQRIKQNFQQKHLEDQNKANNKALENIKKLKGSFVELNKTLPEITDEALLKDEKLGEFVQNTNRAEALLGIMEHKLLVPNAYNKETVDRVLITSPLTTELFGISHKISKMKVEGQELNIKAITYGIEGLVESMGQEPQVRI